MCQLVFRNEEIFSTPRELSTAIGGDDYLKWVNHEGHMDWCLCCIDIPETLARAGLKWRVDRDPLNFIINSQGTDV